MPFAPNMNRIGSRWWLIPDALLMFQFSRDFQIMLCKEIEQFFVSRKCNWAALFQRDCAPFCFSYFLLLYLFWRVYCPPPLPKCIFSFPSYEICFSKWKGSCFKWAKTTLWMRMARKFQGSLAFQACTRLSFIWKAVQDVMDSLSSKKNFDMRNFHP